MTRPNQQTKTISKVSKGIYSMHKGIGQQNNLPWQWQTHQDSLTTTNSVKTIKLFCNPKQQTRN